jgi:hypothetical protein
MAFPSSPINNQVAIVNNISYTYSAVKTAWVRTPPSNTVINILNANVINSLLNITANNFSANGNVTIGQAANFTFNTLTANNINATNNVNINANTITLSNTIIANTLTANQISGNVVLLESTTIGNNTIGYLGAPQKNITATSYTLQMTDAGKTIYLTQGANTGTVIIPTNAVVPFPLGTTILLIMGASFSSNVTAANPPSLWVASNSIQRTAVTLGSYSMSSLIKVATDTWYISGAGAY